MSSARPAGKQPAPQVTCWQLRAMHSVQSGQQHRSHVWLWKHGDLAKPPTPQQWMCQPQLAVTHTAQTHTQASPAGHTPVPAARSQPLRAPLPWQPCLLPAQPAARMPCHSPPPCLPAHQQGQPSSARSRSPVPPWCSTRLQSSPSAPPGWPRAAQWTAAEPATRPSPPQPTTSQVQTDKQPPLLHQPSVWPSPPQPTPPDTAELPSAPPAASQHPGQTTDEPQTQLWQHRGMPSHLTSCPAALTPEHPEWPWPAPHWPHERPSLRVPPGVLQWTADGHAKPAQWQLCQPLTHR